MDAIQTCQTSLTAQIDTVRVDISIVKHEMQKIRARISTAEQRISDIEDALHPMTDDLRSHSQDLKEHTTKLGDLEDRMRRNNLRFIGFPEGIEGKEPEIFLENWLKATMGPDTFSLMFAIERAHRVPMRPLPPGSPPRPLLAKLLHFRDKETVLRTARNMQELKYNGSRVSIFPDYSAATQKQRTAFAAVKRRLRDKQLSYSMLYPAKLRVISDGKAQFFLSPVEASRWLDTLG